MTWKIEAEYRPEVQKCRARLANYCQGTGLDVGCGLEKIVPSAIGVDQANADINCDVSRGLTIFQDNFFDYVFSSHCLEDFKLTGAILSDWWNKLKVGGRLILYLPHKDLYPNIGQLGANKSHQVDLEPADVIREMDQFASYELVKEGVYSEEDEYSFELVLRKLANKKIPLAPKINRNRRQRAIIVRYGAFGDQLIATPLIKRVAQDGYHVTYNCTDRALPVLQNNPYIDEFIVQGVGLIPNAELSRYWDDLKKDYDLFINLSESVECKFLRVPDRPDYHLPVEERREQCGKGNFYDYALELGGYTDVKSPRPELYPTEIEEAMGRYFRAKYADKFLILWCLQGSSMHKCYPWGQDVALEFLNRHQDAITITVGDDICRLIEWDHRDANGLMSGRAMKKAAVWDIRSSLLITKWVDLVISPETGVLNAAGCYDTPKIGFLTHSNKTNLTKYFANDYSMQAKIECSPCHRMIYVQNAATDCPHLDLGEGAWLCACAGAFDPNEVYRRMENVYKKWKEKRNAVVSIIRPDQALRDWNRLSAGGMVNAKQSSLRHAGAAPYPV